MNKLVAIGGSSGSIPVIRELLRNLPDPLEFSVIVVIHQGEECSLTLANILASSTKHPVINPKDNVDILPGYVYIAPPMYHIQVEPNYTISFALDERVKYSRPAIDILFQTAAWSYQDRLLAIVLSGSSEDGSDGAKYVERYGGKVLVQDLDEAESRTMPKATKNLLGIKQTYTSKELCAFIKHWR